MKQLLSVILLISVITVSKAQTVDEEWMNNAKKERAAHPDDDVMLLSGYEKYTFEISYDDKEHPCVKAYKEVIEEYMALKDFVKIGFGEGYDSFSEVKRMSAEQNLGNRYKSIPLQINDREYSSSEIFDCDNRYKYFIFPMNTVGIRMKGGYTKHFSDARYLTSTYFLDRYPIREKVIEVEIPSNIEIELREFNFAGYTINKTVTDNAKNSTKTIIYKIENVNGIPSEGAMPDVSKIFPHIVFVTKNFKDKSGNKVRVFENTADQYNWYKSLLGKIEKNSDNLQPLADKLTKDKSGDVEKIKSIYYWVQDNIKYIAFERGIAGFQPEAASLVYKNKFGDCKGMANLLCTLLMLAGFDARLTWIGTNDRPYDYSLPSMIVDNHMICAVKLNGKFYFLDGTEKYIAFDDYAQRIQGRQALVEEGETYVLQNVPVLPIERNKFREMKTISIDNEILKAKVAETYRGESQTNFLRGVNDISNSKKEQVLTRVLSGNDKNFDITNLSATTFEEREKPIEISYDASISNKVTRLGNETYVSIDFSKDLESLIAEDKRKNPIEVSQNILREYHTELVIPPGYKVKSMPEGLKINTANYAFSVSYSNEQNKVVFHKEIMMKNHITEIKDLSKWNQDLKKLRVLNNEQIVLEKL